MLVAFDKRFCENFVQKLSLNYFIVKLTLKFFVAIEDGDFTVCFSFAFKLTLP